MAAFLLAHLRSLVEDTESKDPYAIIKNVVKAIRHVRLVRNGGIGGNLLSFVAYYPPCPRRTKRT